MSSDNQKLTIIATKGTLDWAYPPFTLASTSAAMDQPVTIFFTFYGLNLLLKDLSHLRVSPNGNPAMPMKLPYGPQWLQNINFSSKIPNIVWYIPGTEWLITWMMKKTMQKRGVAKIEELRDLCQELGVKFIGCEMTIDLFGYNKEDFIDGVEFGGAATYCQAASDAHHSLYI